VADPEANIIFGTSFDDRLGDEVMITVIATGFDATRKRESVRREAGAATPSAGHSQRFDTADFLAELERQRMHAAEPVPVHVRGAARTGQLARSSGRRCRCRSDDPVRSQAGGRSAAAHLRRHGSRDPELPAAASAGGEGVTLRRLGRSRSEAAAAFSAARSRVFRPSPTRAAGSGAIRRASSSWPSPRLCRRHVGGGDRVRADGPRREPRPGGRGQGLAAARRDLASDRPAAVEQGPPGSRAVRRHRSVDSVDLARRLDRLAGELRRAPLQVYLQVNVDRDEAKPAFCPKLSRRSWAGCSNCRTCACWA